MRVGLLTAGFLLTSAIVSNAAIVNISPPPSPPSSKSQAPLPPLPPVPLPPQAPAPVPATAKRPTPAAAPATTKVATPAPVPRPAQAPAAVTAKAPAPAKTPVSVTAKAPVPTPRPATVKASIPAKTSAPVLAKAPAPAPLAAKVFAKAKVTCPCDCPKDQAVSQHARARPAPRRMAHRAFRRYADSGYYNYGAAAPVVRHDWHGQWRVAPNDTTIVPPYGYYQEGVPLDDRGWTGGVGTAPDGYGQAHFANGGSVENGPSYNSYGQSFQFNPSQPGPFQPRLMGGFAPPSSGSR